MRQIKAGLIDLDSREDLKLCLMSVIKEDSSKFELSSFCINFL